MFNIFNRKKKEEEPERKPHITVFTDYYIKESLRWQERQNLRKKFLLRHPETKHIIHTLECISGSVRGINNAVKSLSKNLSELDKMICELSKLSDFNSPL